MSVGPSLVAWRSRQDVQDVQDRQDILKIVALSVFFTPHNFVNIPHFSHSPNFGRPKQGQTFVVPTFHIHLLLLDMSTFDIEHYSSWNENIQAKLFETSYPAGKQITTVNIFQLSLSTKMLSEVMFSWECQLIFLSIAILMVATFTFDLSEIFINWFFSKSPNTPT